jgi:hypothetical protein
MSSYYEKNKVKLREYHRKRYYEQKNKKNLGIDVYEKNEKNNKNKKNTKNNIEEPKFKIEYKKVLIQIP